MGCEHFYTQVQARFETVTDLLLQLPPAEAELHAQLSQELETCLRMIRDFHIVFPECSVLDCLASGSSVPHLREGH